MLLKMEKDVNACVIVILITLDLRSERYIPKQRRTHLRTE